MNDCLSQSLMAFVSKEKGEPIYGVSLYDCNKRLRAISNEDGVVDVSGLCLPLFVKHYEFEGNEITALSDTIYLSLKYKELSEVTVKPVKKMDLYDRIVNLSSIEVKKNNGLRYGNYFQAIMVVNESKGDTSYIDRSCVLAINTENIKKIKDYAFFCKEAIQSYVPFKNQRFDTASINGLLNILPSFESNFKYDLMDANEYKLKFEENEISYVDGNLLGLKFNRKQNSAEQQITVLFDNSKLYYWNSTSAMERPYEGQNIFLNFDHTVRSYYFDTIMYELNGILNKTEVTFFTKGSLYKIFMVQGFEEDIRNKFETSKEVESLKEYFQSSPYSESAPKYYLF